jgi:transcriptional regulator of acetoin/glycerol metabolism
MRVDYIRREGENMIGTIPSSAEMIKSAWQDFVTQGSPGNWLVNPEILKSWQRCYRSGVDPYDGTCYHCLSPRELDELREKRKDLIEIARPFMQRLFEFVQGSGLIVMLTDERGYIIESFGDDCTLQKGAEINFVLGARWTEEQVGTNAIGTALVLRKPLQTPEPNITAKNISPGLVRRRQYLTPPDSLSAYWTCPVLCMAPMFIPWVW